MGKFLYFAVGLIVGALGGALVLISLQTRNATGQDEIVFAPKSFYDSRTIEGGFVSVSGSMVGNGMAYQNNTYGLSCWAELRECFIAQVNQIGPRQIGRIDGPNSIPLVRWSTNQIIAQDDPGDLGCFRTTITIDRTTEKVLWVEEPVNQTKPNRKDADVNLENIRSKIRWGGQGCSERSNKNRHSTACYQGGKPEAVRTTRERSDEPPSSYRQPPSHPSRGHSL
ncbi:hypothetical protein H8B02_28580 [Bradyrhizobium sp. Pear77]|uniref:hypothetical protein n=1 Tax=Bradyrhizobium altum TaxID=1571202 RepID=UPI001E5C4D91|nr:hypothetical protein [Bradyrhizobium altum]MCC8957248.1 hypothetical protein [Bradyrhizobium altum]